MDISASYIVTLNHQRGHEIGNCDSRVHQARYFHLILMPFYNGDFLSVKICKYLSKDCHYEVSPQYIYRRALQSTKKRRLSRTY